MAPDPNGEREKAKKLIEMCGGTFVKNTLRKPPGTIELASTTSQKILESQPPKSRSKNKVEYPLLGVLDVPHQLTCIVDRFILLPMSTSVLARTKWSTLSHSLSFHYQIH